MILCDVTAVCAVNVCLFGLQEKVASPFQAGAVLNSIKSGLLPDPVFPNPSMMSNPLVKGLANQNPKCKYYYKVDVDLDY